MNTIKDKEAVFLANSTDSFGSTNSQNKQKHARTMVEATSSSPKKAQAGSSDRRREDDSSPTTSSMLHQNNPNNFPLTNTTITAISSLGADDLLNKQNAFSFYSSFSPDANTTSASSKNLNGLLMSTAQFTATRTPSPQQNSQFNEASSIFMQQSNNFETTTVAPAPEPRFNNISKNRAFQRSSESVRTSSLVDIEQHGKLEAVLNQLKMCAPRKRVNFADDYEQSYVVGEAVSSKPRAKASDKNSRLNCSSTLNFPRHKKLSLYATKTLGHQSFPAPNKRCIKPSLNSMFFECDKTVSGKFNFFD
jgi:hypothetical protein